MKEYQRAYLAGAQALPPPLCGQLPPDSGSDVGCGGVTGRARECIGCAAYPPGLGSAALPSPGGAVQDCIAEEDADLLSSTASSRPTAPTVSVLMGVRNGATTVLSAIRSIQQQDWEDWELIVVDDASTDGTGELIQSLRDPRITLLRNPQRLYLAAALNKAFSVSRGRLIARQDADDLSLPSRLRLQVEYLESNPSVGILGTSAYAIDAQGRVLGVMPARTDPVSLRRDVLWRSPFIHSSVMMRRETLAALGGYDPTYRRQEDRDLWYRAHKEWGFANLAEPQVCYRVTGKRSRRQKWEELRANALFLRRAASRGEPLSRCLFYGLRQSVGVLLDRRSPLKEISAEDRARLSHFGLAPDEA